jgi:FkbM family methyltransferase
VSIEKQEFLVHGMPMLLDTTEIIQKQMADDCYEPTQTSWVKRILKSGSVFLDVGANFGWFTVLASSLVESGGRVFSFEPSPVAFSTLKQTIDRSDRKNVRLVNNAVGRKSGEIVIYLPNDNMLHSPSAFESPGEFTAMRVPLVSLDEFQPILDLPQIDLVKIDVEGSEPDVLDGMKSLVARARIKRVICEFNSWWLNANKCTMQGLQERFRSLGFDIEAKTDRQQLTASGGDPYELEDILFRHASA